IDIQTWPPPYKDRVRHSPSTVFFSYINHCGVVIGSSPLPFMCARDTISALQTSILFGALAMVPGNTSPYITLGLASVLLAVHAMHHYGPSQRLLRLEDTITATEEILEGAKLDCARDHMTLVERGRRLLEAKLSASEIQTKILEARDETWEEYFQGLRETMEKITKCRKDITAIHTSTLLTIEAERQRQLSAGIQESHEVLNAVVPLSTRHAQPRSRRSGLGAINVPRESDM
ncbi:hypothetical protein B0H17DRAFT_1228265, partial [Mycena rosella]